jgi:acetyltransferase AlgX (SGNH hydrolase-like protein)
MKKNNGILIGIYGFLMMIISLPIIISALGLKSPDEPLKGVTKITEIPELSIESFYNQKYQMGVCKTLNSNMPFSPSLVRFYNQIEYSAFRNMTNKNVVFGDDNYLYQNWHIETYYGKDFVGKKQIECDVKRLVSIDSALKQKDKTLIIALAPGKPDIYPEYIPDYIREEDTELTNYNYYENKLKQSKIPLVDFNSWFKELKPDFERNLFTKNGAHWSRDAELLVLDSLISFISLATGDSLNRIIFDTITVQSNYINPDSDIGEVCNLIFDPGFNDYYYHKFHFDNSYKTDKKILVISDSFFWNIHSMGLSSVFNETQYWFYFNYTKPPCSNDIEKKDFLTELKDADYILLMSSPSPMNKLGWGFINKAYNSLVLNKVIVHDIEKEMAKIRNNPDLFSMIKEKAKVRNISVDSMLRIDAEYICRRK